MFHLITPIHSIRNETTLVLHFSERIFYMTTTLTLLAPNLVPRASCFFWYRDSSICGALLFIGKPSGPGDEVDLPRAFKGG